MGDNRPARYVENDRVIYRASSLGMCQRALVATSQKYTAEPHPDWFRNILDQGTAFEQRIREAYEAVHGDDVVDDQREVELDLGEMFGREIVVRGHIDGVANGEHALFEAKKFRDSTWDNFVRQGIEVNVNYPWQVSVYMHALNLDICHFTGGHVVEIEEPDDSTITDADGRHWRLEEILVKVVPNPPFSLKVIRNRIMEIEKLIDTGFDAKEVECNRSMYPCPYIKLHDYDEDAWEWKDAEQAELADAWMLSFAAVDDQVRQARAALEAAEDKKRTIVAGIRELIAESGYQAEAAKKLIGSDYTLSHVRKTIPAHSRKESVQDYFTIKPNTKGDSDE